MGFFSATERDSPGFQVVYPRSVNSLVPIIGIPVDPVNPNKLRLELLEVCLCSREALGASLWRVP